MTNVDPASLFADLLRKRRARLATPPAQHFDNDDVEVDTTVNNTSSNQTAEHAIKHLRFVGGSSNTMFDLQIALGAVLSLSTPYQDWDLPDTRLCHELLGAIYKALGNAIVYISDQIEIDHLSEGMLAAANLIRDVDRECFGSDRQKDDMARVKKLIHRARIAEHQQDIDNRRRDRERATFRTMARPSAEPAALFG